MPDFYTTTRAHQGAKPGVSPLVSSGTKRRIQGVLDTPWKRVELFRHAQAPFTSLAKGAFVRAGKVWHSCRQTKSYLKCFASSQKNQQGLSTPHLTQHGDQ